MTTFPPDTAPVTPAGVLHAARDTVAGLAEVMWAAKPAAELLDTMVALERLRSTLAAVEAQVAVEVEATEAAKTQGWVSPADYLTSVSGRRKGAGKHLLRTARALTTDRPTTRAALWEGDLSPEQAEVIVHAITRLPTDPATRDRAEAHLVEQAGHLDATDLTKAAAHLVEVVDPDGTARREEQALDKLERAAHHNRELVLRPDGYGGIHLRGYGTVEDAAVIKAALAAKAAPNPATGTGDDGCDHHNDSGESDDGSGCAGHGRDVRDHGARTWDALVAVAQVALDARVLPESHGTTPRVIVTVDYQALRTGLGAGTLDTGDTLSAAAVRRLACDAEIIPVVLGSHGEILDQGRTQRLVTPAQWTALVVRDRHCTFPGCRRPPIACDAHHIRHWVDDYGPTDLDNLTLLCGAHHTLIHATGWRIRTNPADRRPEYKPPPGRGRASDTGWIREPTPRQ